MTKPISLLERLLRLDEFTPPLPNGVQEFIDVKLRPLSNLSADQQAVVRLEYGFTEEVLSFQIRKSLEFYIERRWGLNRPGARLERC